MSLEKEIRNILSSKFWDFPTEIDEQRIVKYDANDNPLIIEFYRNNDLKFTHIIEYDGSGRMTKKKLVRAL